MANLNWRVLSFPKNQPAYLSTVAAFSIREDALEWLRNQDYEHHDYGLSYEEKSAQ